MDFFLVANPGLDAEKIKVNYIQLPKQDFNRAKFHGRISRGCY